MRGVRAVHVSDAVKQPTLVTLELVADDVIMRDDANTTPLLVGAANEFTFEEEVPEGAYLIGSAPDPGDPPSHHVPLSLRRLLTRRRS